MINQQALESLFLATYLEDYFDSCENLPDDVQKQATRMRELDVEYQKFLKDVEHQLTVLLECPDVPNSSVWKVRIQHALMNAQDKGDEKLQITQQIQDYMDNKVRQLDLDLKNLGYSRDQDTETKIDATTKTIDIITEKPVKRARRARHEVYVPSILGPSTLEATSFSDAFSSGMDSHPTPNRNSSSHSSSHVHNTSAVEIVSAKSSNSVVATTVTSSAQSVHGETVSNSSKSSSGTQVVEEKVIASSSGFTASAERTTNSTTTTPKKQSQHKRDSHSEKKYKKRKKQPDNSPPSIPIDPDEPTYCLCDQVSYGEMIGCDNDLCPIEWFHFSCVLLNSKPKGKWYCPKCRGDRPNVMKPKAIFLKELEKYNREKEEKS